MMELVEDFGFLSVGINKRVRNAQNRKTTEVAEIVETDEDYEKVCRKRWSDCDAVRMVLETKFPSGRKLTWKEFYETLDELPNKWKLKKPKTFPQEFVQTSKRTSNKRAKNDIDYEVRALSSGPVFVAAASRPALASARPEYRIVYRKVLDVKREAWVVTNFVLKNYECSIWVACTLLVVDDGDLKAISFPSAEQRQVFHLRALFGNDDLPKVQCIRMSAGVVMLLFMDNTIAFLSNQHVLPVAGDPLANVFTIEANSGVFFAGTATGEVHRYALEFIDEQPTMVKLGSRKYFDNGQIFIVAVSGTRIAVATKSAVIFEQLNEDPKGESVSCYIHTGQDPLVNIAYFGDLVVTLSINSFLTVGPFAERTYFWHNRAPRTLIEDSDRLVANQSYLTITEEAAVVLLPNGTLCFWQPQQSNVLSQTAETKDQTDEEFLDNWLPKNVQK